MYVLLAPTGTILVVSHTGASSADAIELSDEHEGDLCKSIILNSAHPRDKAVM